MAYGDPSYAYISGGSTATSAATPHDLYGGLYGGLSDLNATDILLITLSASTGLASIGPSGTGGQLAGFFLAPSAVLTLPALTRNDASQLKIHRQVASNPVVYWSVWSRRSL